VKTLLRFIQEKKWLPFGSGCNPARKDDKFVQFERDLA
jgi:hypothetical protein